MTVIAYRDGVVAADSQISWSGLKVPGHVKLHIVKGHIVGAAGDVGAIGRFLDWFKSDRAKDADFKTENFDALTMNARGEVQSWDKQLCPHDINLPFFAIGSGAGLAIGAMERGATASEACQVACKWDDGCSGEVIIKTINDLVEKSKRKR